MDGRTDSNLNLAGGQSKKGGKWLMFGVIFLVALIALVAVIVAAVALGRSRTPSVTVTTPNGSGSGSGSGGSSNQGGSGNGSPGTPGRSPGGGKVCNRLYTIAGGHDWGAYEYFDDRGFRSGFAQDIIDAACREAGIVCQFVWDKYTNCWDSQAGTHPSGGEGLFEKWYDACTGWGKTVERMHVFDFSLAFIKGTKSYFYVHPDNDNFDPSNVEGKTIAFFDGWYSDEKCLARYNDSNHRGYDPPLYTIRHVTAGPTDVLPLLEQGSVNAVLAGAHDMDALVQSGQVRRLSEAFNCLVGGHGMMTRRDSRFNAAFNLGLQRIRANGVYRDLCQAAKENHGSKGLIECIE